MQGCNLELLAVDAVLGVCRKALADLNSTMESDQEALQLMMKQSSEQGMSAPSQRRMSILRLRIQERRILNRTVSVLVSQKRQLSSSGQRVRAK